MSDVKEREEVAEEAENLEIEVEEEGARLAKFLNVNLEGLK